MKKKNYIALAFVAIALAFLLIPFEKKVPYIKNEGKIHGTFYSITYQQPDHIDLKDSIERQMKNFESSLSTFNPNSTISKINQNEAVETDSFFEQMYAVANKVSSETNGAFDITVAPLVNAWGFGFKESAFPTAQQIDSILEFVGYKKTSLQNHRLTKTDFRIMLDASAIAKGFSVDIVAKLLEKHGCKNYLVDIGGEIVCKGKNAQGKKWSIGINKPVESPLQTGEIQLILNVSDIAMATSGNYRQFYYRDGKKYAHTINPLTGYPVEHTLLSATIIAPTCMEADAFATACMVLGTEESITLCNKNKDIEGFFIFSEGDSLKTIYSEGFKTYIN